MRKFPQCWVMPGGHVEAGEELHDAVCREIEEEVGMNVATLEKQCNVHIEPFYVFESVSECVHGVTPPSHGHMILFYRV